MVVSPAPFALRPYVCNLPVKVGRFVWCLNCFEVPRRPYQAWKQGRCGGTTPTYAMPSGLRDGIVRMPERPDLPPAMQGRWAVLVSACRAGWGGEAGLGGSRRLSRMDGLGLPPPAPCRA